MLATIDDVISTLGGTSAALKLLGLSRASTVSNWRARGRIPSAHYFAVSEALKALGIDVDTRLFEKTAAHASVRANVKRSRPRKRAAA